MSFVVMTMGLELCSRTYATVLRSCYAMGEKPHVMEVEIPHGMGLQSIQSCFCSGANILTGVSTKIKNRIVG